jgi:hypothetical protein
VNWQGLGVGVLMSALVFVENGRDWAGLGGMLWFGVWEGCCVQSGVWEGCCVQSGVCEMVLCVVGVVGLVMIFAGSPHEIGVLLHTFHVDHDLGVMGLVYGVVYGVVGG